MSNDTEPKILIVPPGAVSAEDRTELRSIGVVVIETDEPDRCRFLQASQSLSSGDMLWAAMDALRRNFSYGNEGTKQREQLALNLFALIGADADARGGLSGQVRANRKAAADTATATAAVSADA